MHFRMEVKTFITMRTSDHFNCVVWQSVHDELEAKFHEERTALEAKYQKLYEPLYIKVWLSYWEPP